MCPFWEQTSPKCTMSPSRPPSHPLRSQSPERIPHIGHAPWSSDEDSEADAWDPVDPPSPNRAAPARLDSPIIARPLQPTRVRTDSALFPRPTLLSHHRHVPPLPHHHPQPARVSSAPRLPPPPDASRPHHVWAAPPDPLSRLGGLPGVSAEASRLASNTSGAGRRIAVILRNHLKAYGLYGFIVDLVNRAAREAAAPHPVVIAEGPPQ